MRIQKIGAASAVAIIMLATACSSRSGSNSAPLNVEKSDIVVDAFPAIDSVGLNGQLAGCFDTTAGDYVTYIENELAGTAKLRIFHRGCGPARPAGTGSRVS